MIVRRSARILEIDIEEEGAHEIAARSRGTPRVANRLLKRVRDYAEVRLDGVVGAPTPPATRWRCWRWTRSAWTASTGGSWRRSA